MVGFVYCCYAYDLILSKAIVFEAAAIVTIHAIVLICVTSMWKLGFLKPCGYDLVMDS